MSILALRRAIAERAARELREEQRWADLENQGRLLASRFWAHQQPTREEELGEDQ